MSKMEKKIKIPMII